MAPARGGGPAAGKGGGGGSSARLVSTLLTELDNLGGAAMGGGRGAPSWHTSCSVLSCALPLGSVWRGTTPAFQPCGRHHVPANASPGAHACARTRPPLTAAARVVVVGATNRPDALDGALRRPGRLDREVEVGVPPPADRRDILARQLAGMAHDLTPLQVAQLADGAHGYVAADLAALASEAALIALRRLVVAAGAAPGGAAAGGPPCVTLADFRAAEARTRPSAMRELAFEIPKVRWAGGWVVWCRAGLVRGGCIRAAQRDLGAAASLLLGSQSKRTLFAHSSWWTGVVG